MSDIDITEKVDFGRNDDEWLPFHKCVCGQEFEYWDFSIGMERDYPTNCPQCGRKLYFTLDIRVWEVVE